MIHQYQPQTSSSNRGKSLDLLYFGSILLSIHSDTYLLLFSVVKDTYRLPAGTADQRWADAVEKEETRQAGWASWFIWIGRWLVSVLCHSSRSIILSSFQYDTHNWEKLHHIYSDFIMNSDNIPDNISTFKISNRDTKLEDGYTVNINVPKTAVCDDGTDFSACFAAIWGLFFGYHYALERPARRAPNSKPEKDGPESLQTLHNRKTTYLLLRWFRFNRQVSVEILIRDIISLYYCTSK